MKKWFKYLLITIVCIYIVILLWGVFTRCKQYILQKYVYLNSTETLVGITYGKYKFNIKKGQIVFDESGFFIDSGCSSSFILPDTLSQLKNIYINATICITDANNQTKNYPLFYLRKIKLQDSLTIKNVVAYPCIGTNKEESAIGMDVISTANWHFNFKNNIVNIIPTSETETIPTKNIAFSYTKTKDPLTNLYIGNFCFHDVLLDMGMKSWDICLSDTDILQLLNTYKPKDSAEVTSNGLNGSVQTMEYYFDSLNIEKEIYKNICIKKGKKNIIGIDFFRRFNHLFWDSKHKKVYLWNNEK